MSGSTYLMLLTLAAAAEAESGDWPGVAGLDALEEGVAVGTARKAGLIDDAGHLTAAGRAWARRRLAPLGPLSAATAARADDPDHPTEEEAA